MLLSSPHPWAWFPNTSVTCAPCSEFANPTALPLIIPPQPKPASPGLTLKGPSFPPAHHRTKPHTPLRTSAEAFCVQQNQLNSKTFTLVSEAHPEKPQRPGGRPRPAVLRLDTHQNRLEASSWAPTPVSGSAGLGWDLRLCVLRSGDHNLRASGLDHPSNPGQRVGRLKMELPSMTENPKQCPSFHGDSHPLAEQQCTR